MILSWVLLSSTRADTFLYVLYATASQQSVMNSAISTGIDST